jgi:type VI secretion system protein ImpH
VWDVQHKFRIAIGPLRLDRFRRFLPGGADLARLQALVRSWVGIEFAWDVRLILLRDVVPRARLGSRDTALGHASWLGRYRRSGNADDLCIDVERSRAARVAPGTLPAEADFSAWPQGAPGTA